MKLPEFSYRTRTRALERMRSEMFDVLIIGGGITGAAVARDAVMRGLRVALVEARDFASGTSSRSSKLIHGGLRYLENFELGLVFEALSERTLLLKTAPHMVRPLPFYMPVYKGDRVGMLKLSAGLWLYDLLSVFRTPGIHRRLSRKKVLRDIPFLKSEGLEGGYRYFDASMWDDVLVLETARDASARGAAIVNYVEALSPLWTGDKITGFRCVDRAPGVAAGGSAEFDVRAAQLIVCGGPWTDELGERLSKGHPEKAAWTPWLAPSKGVHLIFDHKRLPVPGAMVMSQPQDGRISFVIPRFDFGAGVTIVGTTDGPTPADPQAARVDPADIDYLLALLQKYFPTLQLTANDVISSYVGVRPLFKPEAGGAESLQKVSREHHIGRGPGGAVLVAGGKYTTHRCMAQEIVDLACPDVPKAPTETAVNAAATPEARDAARAQHAALSPRLFDRYGAAAVDVAALADAQFESPEGFPALDGQLRHSVRTEMVVQLEDFYFRREPLYAARKDHGLPWAGRLAKIWAEARGLTPDDAAAETHRLERAIAERGAKRI